MFFSVSTGSSAALSLPLRCNAKISSQRVVAADAFPSFLPREMHTIQDPLARKFAMRIQRLPVPVNISSFYFLQFLASSFGTLHTVFASLLSKVKRVSMLLENKLCIKAFVNKVLTFGGFFFF